MRDSGLYVYISISNCNLLRYWKSNKRFERNQEIQREKRDA